VDNSGLCSARIK